MTSAGTPEMSRAAPSDGQSDAHGFEVHLANFEGPFDLLLSLISKHKLDITEVALAQITDEFVAYVKVIDWDLDETSEFLVVAATLLDLKAARLLPSGSVEDEDDLALLEARDLLFARLLQYKAFKEIADVFAARLSAESLRHPRAVSLEDRYTNLLPEVVLSITPDELAQLAASALTPKEPPTVSVSHLHHPRVSVREQAAIVVQRLTASGQVSFRSLVADCESTLVVVARFLSLLELYREKVVAFEQLAPLGDLTIRWTGTENSADVSINVSTEFDQELTMEDEKP